MEQFSVTIPQIFVVIGLLLMLAELVLGIQTGLDLLLIGSILVISGFVGIFTGSEAVMLILAIALSILYIAVGRKKIRQRITTVTNKTNIDKLVGNTGLVMRAISPDTPGMVRVNDEDWRASAEEVLYERDPVIIEGIEGVTLIVRKLNK